MRLALASIFSYWVIDVVLCLFDVVAERFYGLLIGRENMVPLERDDDVIIKKNF